MQRIIRLVLIVPHDLNRHGLQMLVTVPGSRIRVVGAFPTLEDGEAQLDGCAPHVLLLDDTLAPPEVMATLIARLRRQHPDLVLLILSSRLNKRYVQSLLACGILGFVYREDRLEEALVPGIEMVSQGHYFVSPRASSHLFLPTQGVPMAQLNQTDMEVLRLIGMGLTMKGIASTMGVSLKTVYRARGKLRVVLHVPTNDHIVAAARSKGLLPDPEAEH